MSHSTGRQGLNRRRLLALSSGLFVGALAGCVGDDDPDDDEPGNESEDENGDRDPSAGTDPNIDDEQLATLVGETNGFAFDLYRELLDEHPDENVFASPVSIALALAMTYAGADGETREQMREVLRYQLDDEEVHEAFAALQNELDARSEHDPDGNSAGENGEEKQPFELSVANSMWGQSEYPFEQDFLDTLEMYYGDGFREVDFGSDFEGAREDINDWVADETEDRIEELLPEGALDSLTRLVLVNAVYFLANWEHTFPEHATTEKSFTALSGSTHEVPMMHHTDVTVPYTEVDGAQAVDLPYVGGEVSMLVILPPDGEFESYEQSFDGETLTAIVENLERTEGRVELPRFEIEGTFQLGKRLESMGMVDAFDPEAANFERIADPAETDENLYVWEVYHDTFVSVDEKGTEAAAATGVVVGDESAPMDPFEFVADRPFLFAIRDRPTGAILFFGRAIDPASWE